MLKYLKALETITTTTIAFFNATAWPRAAFDAAAGKLRDAQLSELLKAKEHIIRAIEMEGEDHV